MEGNVRNFSVTIGSHSNSKTLTLVVENGVIVKYSEDSYIGSHITNSHVEQVNIDEKDISSFFETYLHTYGKIKYSDLVSNLDKTMLDKYFVPSFLPK